jgi:hypothetical protein
MAKEYLSIWTIEFLIKILSLFQGKTLMIDPYTVVATLYKDHMMVGSYVV